MSNRHNHLFHLFQFKAAEISAAACEEAAYHSSRITWWESEQELAIKLAREAGIEIREHEITGGKNVEVVVDVSITKRLSQCATKIANHQSAADRFTIEAAAYGSQPEALVYELDPDDVVYFRLAGGPRED